MPYKRTYKKRVFKKRAYRKRASVASMTVSGLKKALKIKSPEIKLSDVISAPTNISTTLSGITFGYGISQGLTNLTRLGRAITLKSYFFRMTIYPDPSATSPGEVRMIWIWQKFPNLSLQTPANTLQTVTNIHSPYQIDTTGYKILYDRTHSFAITDNRNKYLTVKLPLPKSGVPVKWSEADTTGNSANLEQGYIRGFIMYNGFSGSFPSYDLFQRVKFIDS